MPAEVLVLIRIAVQEANIELFGTAHYTWQRELGQLHDRERHGHGVIRAYTSTTAVRVRPWNVGHKALLPRLGPTDPWDLTLNNWDTHQCGPLWTR